MSIFTRAPRLLLSFAPACILLAACSGAGAEAANQHSTRDATSAPKAPAAPAQQKESKMSAEKSCKDDNLHRAICMIELVMADLDANYGQVGGGGISRIEAASSTSYKVFLPQEERIDVILYTFDVGDGKVAIKDKTSSTENF